MYVNLRVARALPTPHVYVPDFPLARFSPLHTSMKTHADFYKGRYGAQDMYGE